LKEDGYVIMEMGYKHKEAVEKIANEANMCKIIEWIKDYSGHWRGVVLKYG